MITTIVLGAFAGFLALIGALIGRSRGLARQCVRFVTVILAIVNAILLTKWLEKVLLSKISSMSGDSLVDTLDGFGLGIKGSEYEILLRNVDPSTLSYIIAIPLALVIAPLVFVLLFAIIKLLMIILHKIFCAICGFSKRPLGGWVSRLLGAILGAVQGALVAVVVTVPVIGLLTTSSELVETLEDKAPGESATVTLREYYDDYAAPFAEDPAVNAYSTLGGKFLYNQFTTVEIEDEEYDIIGEISAPAAKIVSATGNLENFDWTKPTNANKRGLTLIITAVDESGYVKTIVLDVVRTVVDTYNEGGLTFNADDLLVEMIDSCFSVVASISSDSFSSDMATIIDAYIILGREGALESFNTGEIESVREALTATYISHELDPKTPCDYKPGGTTVLTKVVEILESNEHTKALISSLSKISISALASSFGSNLSTEEAYTIVKSGVDATLRITRADKDEEVYKAEVRASLEQTLANADIVFEEEQQYILDNMTDYVNENYDELAKPDANGNPTVSDDEINKVILSYYESYMNGDFDEEAQQ